MKVKKKNKKNSEGQSDQGKKPDLTVNTVPVSKLFHWIKGEKTGARKQTCHRVGETLEQLWCLPGLPPHTLSFCFVYFQIWSYCVTR